ncbi:MAG: MerR family transcriptional regulator [Blautia sp.]|nr:MerR family transcriptional regulator [Blautia sp.]MDY5032270.1 MerR family transcriptional regulator [Blautia sp.]
MGNRYTVHQTVEKTGVKSYVLRYWEEELQLSIGRNELGHRYYTEDDIQLFLKVKELKEKGIQLKTIREQLLPQTGTNNANPSMTQPQSSDPAPESSAQESVRPEMSAREITRPEAAVQGVKRQEIQSKPNGKILEFHQILERLIAQEMKLQDQEEGRCRSLDHMIRSHQIARREAAAAAEAKKRKKK